MVSSIIHLKNSYFSSINFEEIFICLCVISKNIMYICIAKKLCIKPVSIKL